MIVDGKALANEITSNLKHSGAGVNFCAVLVGDNPSSVLYINKKQKACSGAGINMRTIKLPAGTTQKQLNKTMDDLSRDNKVHAILLQLPLPHGLDEKQAISYMAPEKDVDGLTAENFGKLASGQGGALAPCTALGIVHILKSQNVTIAGADVCVVGRSNIVGKPVALLLSTMDATVTLCHSKTKDLAKHTKNADIVIAAAGVPGLLGADMIKKGAVVIDVGVNRLDDGTICGDIDFAAISKKASVVTPVPGGVGPLTIAFLLSNIMKAFEQQRRGQDV